MKNILATTLSHAQIQIPILAQVESQLLQYILIGKKIERNEPRTYREDKKGEYVDETISARTEDAIVHLEMR